MDTYILDAAGQPVSEPDLTTWGHWMADQECHLAHDVVGDVGEPDPRLVLHTPEDWLVHRKFSPENLLEKVARALHGPVLHGERDLV